MHSNCAQRNAAVISEGKNDDPVSTIVFINFSTVKTARLVPFSQNDSAA